MRASSVIFLQKICLQRNTASALEDFYLHIYRLCDLLLPLQQEDFIMLFNKQLMGVSSDWQFSSRHAGNTMQWSSENLVALIGRVH